PPRSGAGPSTCPTPPSRCREVPPATVSSASAPSSSSLSARAAPRMALTPRTVFTEHLLDPSDRLSRTSFVFDHREPDVLVAELAEADSRRHRDLCARKKLLRELERARGAIGLGNPRP